MSSSRLPGKSMKRIGTLPIIDYVIKRVMRAKKINYIIVAITTSEHDDILAEHISSLGIDVFRGSENDVLDRYFRAVESKSPYSVVRITGDCPLISPKLIDLTISKFEKEDVDYIRLVTGENEKNAFPRGFDVEIAKFEALSQASKEATEKYEREHVMPYLYTNPNKFKNTLMHPSADASRPNYRLCVDTPEDYKMLLGLYNNLGDDLIDIDYLSLIKFLDKHPELVALNMNVKQKKFTKVDERYK